MEERRARSSSAKPLDFALRRLARRSHGENELSEKMVRAGYTAAEIAETLEFLRARRYLDDSAFARDLARSAAEHRRWGPLRVEKKLRELKLPERSIESAIEEAFPDGELEAARSALDKFLSRPRRGAGKRLRAGAYRHLLGRGFSPSVAYRLVSTGVFEDTEDSEAT